MAPNVYVHDRHIPGPCDGRAKQTTGACAAESIHSLRAPDITYGHPALATQPSCGRPRWSPPSALRRGVARAGRPVQPVGAL